MHFGFLTGLGEAAAAARYLTPLIEDVRGQITPLILDWQRVLGIGQTVLYVDIEAGPLTRRHEDTGAIIDDCIFAAGEVLEPYERGFVRVSNNLIPAATVIGPVPPGTPVEEAKAITVLKNHHDWVIVDHCLCFRA